MTMKKELIHRSLEGGNLICKPYRYGRPSDDLLPDTEDAKAIVLGLRNCQQAFAEPEYTAFFENLTGRYEGESSRCCINQAGYHMELWWSRNPKRDDTRFATVWRGHADFDPETGLFEIRERAGGERMGTIVSDPPRLTIEWTDGTAQDTLTRVSKRATMSDRAVGLLRGLASTKDPLAAHRIAQEHIPVSQRRLEALWEVLRSRTRIPSKDEELRDKTLRQLLQALFEIEPGGGNQNVESIMTAIKRICEALSDALSGFPQSERDRAGALSIWVLLSWTESLRAPSGTHEVRTLYEWFQRVLHYDREFALAPMRELSVIKRSFRVRLQGKFRYRVAVDLKVIGWDVGFGVGKLLAKKLAPKVKAITDGAIDRAAERWSKIGKHADRLKKWKDKAANKALGKITKFGQAHAGGRLITGVMVVESPEAAWTEAYVVHALFGGGGRDSGLKGYSEMLADGWAETGVAWTPEAFCGQFVVLPGLEATGPDGKRAADQCIWLLEGSGADGSLQVVFDEVKTDALRADIGWGYGVVDTLEDDAKIVLPELPERDGVFDYATEYAQDAKVHFALSSATVGEDARQALRIFAACELAELRDPTSSLVIGGFADRLGPKWYNRELSLARAGNVEQALHDCMGDDFHAKVKTFGMGEELLEVLDEAFDFPNNAAQPEWRRSFVVLDAHAGISLRTRDLKDG
jgi:outer membrane protein OmpA-like peptidoglycan-associated protein